MYCHDCGVRDKALVRMNCVESREHEEDAEYGRGREYRCGRCGIRVFTVERVADSTEYSKIIYGSEKSRRKR